jgi:hypothetical protein
MKYIFLILLIVSCSIKGPNYNQGKTHNDSNANRKSIVLKEDKRMKNAMIKHRTKTSRGKYYNSKMRKVNKKYI